MQVEVDSFLQQFLSDVPKLVPDKIKHWLYVANNAALVYPDAEAAELKRRRRNARNNVRRLAAKHPDLLPALRLELEGQ